MYDCTTVSNLKQVILIRRDLKLRRAAVAALAAKASCVFLLDNDEAHRGDELSVSLTRQEAEWLRGASTRIVLGVSSEHALHSLMAKAELSGLQCYAVEGSTSEGDDKEDATQTIAVAIGPDEADLIDQLTGNLKLI